MSAMRQDLSAFKVPASFRGRSAIAVQLWWLVQASLFRHSPQVAYGFRRWLLRLFGCNVGPGVLIRPSATITYPWKVTLSENAWIGDDVLLYSLGQITIGSNAVVSQRSYLCAGDHDFESDLFDIRARAITVGEEAWVASDVFVAPGVAIGAGAIVGARSSVFSDVPADMVCFGTPCKAIRPRIITRRRNAN